jgi:hypothetical protein
VGRGGNANFQEGNEMRSVGDLIDFQEGNEMRSVGDLIDCQEGRSVSFRFPGGK